MDYKYERIKNNKTYYKNKYIKTIFTSEYFHKAFENSINEVMKSFFIDLHMCVDEAQPDLFKKEVVDVDIQKSHLRIVSITITAVV